MIRDGMRILHLVTRSHFRGAETTAFELSQELDRLGHHNRLVAVAPAIDGGVVADLPPVSRLTSLRPHAVIAAAWKLRRLLSREPFDVVLGHGGIPTEVAALALWGRHTPLVWQRVQPLPTSVWRPVRRRLLGAVASRVDAAVVITSDFERELRRLGFRGPVWSIPNARRPERFLTVDRAEAARALRAELGLEDDVALIGLVGALFDVKRPDRALDVIAALRDAGERACLLVAGDGPLRTELGRDVARRSLTGVVRLLGHRRDVERILGALDMLLVTSDVEGVPGVAIEAAMAGCPVVTFPVGGVAEVVDDGVTGVVLDQPDALSMAACVARLLHDTDTRRSISDAARSRAARFSAGPVAAQYAEELTRLVARYAAAAGIRRERAHSAR